MTVAETIGDRTRGAVAQTGARQFVDGIADGDQNAGLVVIRDGSDDLRPPESAAELARIVGVSVVRTTFVDGGAGSPAEHFGDDEVLQALERGTIYMPCETACTAGDKCFVRHTATGAEEFGAVRNDVDGTDAVQVEGLVFDETLAGTGLVRVRVNLPA